MEDALVAEAIAQFNEANKTPTPKINVEVTAPSPSLAQQTAFDLAVNKKVMEKFHEAGIRNPNDFGSGRADQGRLANLLREAEYVDGENGPQINPFVADKIMRNADYMQQAGVPLEAPESPEPTAPTAAPAPSAQPDLAAALAAKDAELKDWQKKYGDRENRLGEERRKVAERLARLEAGANGGYTPPQPVYRAQPAPVSYDPRILGERDPNQPLTAGETAALLQSMAAAFGQQLTARDSQLIDAARNLRNYDLTPNEEADLIEKHQWLASLDRSSQISAMRDLAPSIRTPTPVAPAAAPLTPQRTNLENLARARVRSATTFIEPSSQGSPQETSAAEGGIASDYGKKMSRIQELLRTPGGAEEAEKLINELSARRH